MAAAGRWRVSSWKTVAVLLVSLLALAGATGCGGGGSDDRLTKEEYLQEFAAIGNDLEGSFNQLVDADVDTNDFDQIADLTNSIGDSLDELAGRVDSLSPPEEIEASHDKLVDGLEEFAGWAHELADKITTAPAAELVGIVEQYGLTGDGDFDPAKVPGADKIQEAVEEFQTAGYQLGDTETETTATDTEPPPPDADTVAGKEIFAANCTACHTLADADAHGSIGPDLDAAKPSYALAVDRVTNGRGVMPPFGSQLSEQQIQDVAAYVSSVAGG
jgi:mono/diheme cytochrome c family protein